MAACAVIDNLSITICYTEADTMHRVGFVLLTHQRAGYEMTDIQTGGGGSVGHDVETKRDFVGRDQYNFPAANMSTDEKLDLLIARVVGDSLRGDTGLVAAVREMSERLQRLEKTMDTQQAKSVSDTEYRWRREQEVDGRFNAVFFWIVGAYVVAVLEGLIMIVHILGT